MTVTIKRKHFRRSAQPPRRGRRIKAFYAKVQAALNGTGAAATVTFTNGSPNVTLAAHGFVAGQGPFVLSNSGGALPTNFAASTLYWVISVVDVNNFTLGLKRGATAITAGSAGTGTQTITKDSSLAGIRALLKRYKAARMLVETDVDNLK